MLLYGLVLLPFTPRIGDLRKAKSEAPSVLLASDGSVLTEYRSINRQWVTLDKIAPHVVNALIATEDHRFYQHHGIDFRRTAGALLSTLSGDLQGGSTITQRLARNLYPEEIGRATSITRKVKEAMAAQQPGAKPLNRAVDGGDVFQQAFRKRRLDSAAEFAIPRPPPPGPKNAALTAA